MTLSGKQKRELKGRGQTMTDDLRLGKDGLSEGFIRRLDDLLADRDLVKLRFTDVEGAMRKTLAAEIAGSVDAECVSIIGRTMLLYRAPASGRDDGSAPTT